MRELVYTYELENTIARLNQIREVLYNREFFAGRQAVYWSQTEMRWKLPNKEDLTPEEWADVELISNIFQGYVLICMAELSQSPPRTAFSPAHPKVLADTRLARDATSITGYINRANRVDGKLPFEIYLLALDGAFGEYWRFVRDPKFGVEDYQVQEGEVEQEIAPNRAVCPSCQSATPTETPDAAPPACDTCGSPMGPDSFAPRQTEMVPNIVTRQRPAGREVCDVVGMLEMVIPAYEKDEEELGFLTWCREVHKSKLMAIFPEHADEIDSGPTSQTATSTQERIARLSLLSGWRHTTDGQTALVTFRESWFRPWTYQTLRQKFGGQIIERMLALWPNGVKVAFAGDAYCGCWDEALQEHWTLCHAYPGEGQYRQALGSAAISSQRKYNKSDSIKMETLERGLPFQVADTDVWNVNALEGRTEAAAVYPAQGRGNKTVQNSIWTSPPVPMSSELTPYTRELRGEIMQHQFGAYPAMYGGDTGSNDTAHGIAIERNAAKGRMGLVYRALKDHRARADAKNIKLFLKSRTQDVEIAVEGPGSQWNSTQIALADIRNGSVEVKADQDESYPVSINEQRSQISTLVNNANPAILQLFGDPANAEQLMRILGMEEIVRIPGAAAREKCFDIINELVKTGPNPPPIPPAPVAAGMGAPGPESPPPPPMPAPPEPSIEPDPILDDLPTYVKTCQEWAASEQGRQAQLENPPGYDNVRAFAAKCQQLLAPPPMPPMPPPARGGSPKNLPAPPEQNLGPGGLPPAGPAGPM